MRKPNKRLIHCVECGRNRRHRAKGLCCPCYSYQRYQENGERMREANREWREANPDYHRQYCETHKARKGEAKKRWVRDNAARLRAYQHGYQKTHRAERRGYSQRRNALKAGLPATLTEAQWQEILEEHGHGCAYCGRADLPLEQEHVMPVTRGGGYTAANIVPACQPCNRKKQTKTPAEYAAWLVQEGLCLKTPRHTQISSR